MKKVLCVLGVLVVIGLIVFCFRTQIMGLFSKEGSAPEENAVYAVYGGVDV